MLSKLTLLKKNTGLVRYLKNTSWMFLEQLLRIVAGLFVGVWIARYLGPEQFGLFSYVIAFTSMFSCIAKLGLDGIVVREIINSPEKTDELLGTAFWLKIVGAFLVLSIIIAIVPLTNNDKTTYIFILIITSGLIFQSFEVIEFYFQSQVLAKIVSICKVIQLALSSIIKIYLVINEAELIYFVYVTLFDSISLAVSYVVTLKFGKKSMFFKYFRFTFAKQLLKDSWPLIFTSIVVMVYMRIDQIMIKEMLGSYEVGIYSAGIKISELLYFIPILITSSIFPAIINAKKKDIDLYNSRLQQLYSFLVWLALIIAVFITFLADWIILLLFGENYQSASEVLIIHVWSAIFVFLGVSFSKYLLAENLTKIAFHRTLLGSIVNVLLNWYFIPIYGIKGAALATLIAQFTVNYAYDIFDYRLHEQFKIKNRAIFKPGIIIKSIKRYI